MASTSIRSIRAREVLDSRGRPTVEVDVTLTDGSCGRASVPSGASTGAAEAHELRDLDAQRFEGRGVLRAVANVNGPLAANLAAFDALDQRGLDQAMCALDGTNRLTRLGGNAVLGVSLAACRAAAIATAAPLHARIAELAGVTQVTLPLPMMNILSGGLHAGRGMDVQDFLILPLLAPTLRDAIHTIARVRSAATTVSAERGLPTLLADEGGLSPGLASGREALQLLVAAIEHAGMRPGHDVGIAIDVAASSLKSQGGYRFARERCERTSDEVIDLVADWARDFPVLSIEDALDEEDWAGWQRLTARLGAKVQLIGDDLFTTNTRRLARGVREHVGNAVLIKLNQIGTVTGALETIAQARAHRYASIVSARSGETEDSFIADFAVGTAAGQIKIGSLRGSERLSKYNQLLRIEEATRAPYAGANALLRPQ